MSTRFTRLIVAALGLLALSSCSKGVLDSPGAATPTPIFEASGLPRVIAGAPDSSLSDSLVVDGLVGGTLTVGSFRVIVPPDAIKGRATITITQPDPSVLKCDLAISPPSANQFLLPVTLAAKLPSSSLLSVDTMLWYDPSAKLWRYIATTSDAVTCELHSPLWHFSQYGAGRAGW